MPIPKDIADNCSLLIKFCFLSQSSLKNMRGIVTKPTLCLNSAEDHIYIEKDKSVGQYTHIEIISTCSYAAIEISTVIEQHSN